LQEVWRLHRKLCLDGDGNDGKGNNKDVGDVG